MLKIGTTTISNLYIGNSQKYFAYLGDTLVFGSSGPTDYSKECLTFEFDGTGTFIYANDCTGSQDIEYSLNNGSTWINCSDGATINITPNTKIQFRGNNCVFEEFSAGCGYDFHTEDGNGDFNTINTTISGNFMSLQSKSNFSSMTAFPIGYYGDYIFSGLRVSNVDNLILPATGLTDSCYQYMFYTDEYSPAKTFTTAPVLPAVYLAPGCYREMFEGCSNLNYIECYAEEGIDNSNGELDNWVNGVAASGTFVKSPYAIWPAAGVNSIPSGWTVEGNVDFSKEYLTFNIITGGTICFQHYSTGPEKTINYKINDGDWSSLTSTSGGSFINVSAGDKVKLKGINATGNYENDRFTSGGTAVFDIYGNIMSLVAGDDFSGATTLGASKKFSQFFYGAKVRSAKKLILPAISLTRDCYSEMFRSCDMLTTAPEELPATSLEEGCYAGMFRGCTSLTTVPVELPATTLVRNCYANMFLVCTSLTTAPELPATTLANYCYASMFKGCTSLTTAPELPATTLVAGCYESMFQGCSSLAYIKCLATDISATTAVHMWVLSVAASGTFVKNPNMSSWPTATSSNDYKGIPSGWTVQDAS